MSAFISTATDAERAVMLLIIFALATMVLMATVTYSGAKKSARRRVGRIYSDPRRVKHHDRWNR